MESECGLQGILLHYHKYVTEDYEDLATMALKKFHEFFGCGVSDGNRTIYFFMPPLLREGMESCIKKSLIPEDKICNKCNEVFEERLRRLREGGILRDREE
jgi:hypothetical protein